MTLEEFLLRLVPALERAQVPYMLTGSVASSAHGAPRSTRDLDIVIAPTREQLLALMKQFPNSLYYADEQQALEALANRSQFNVIDYGSNWKVDFIICKNNEFGRAEFARRRVMTIGLPIYVASPEDVLISKLEWARMGESDRQIEDAAGILRSQREGLDGAYIERWIRELHLDAQWELARRKAAEP